MRLRLAAVVASAVCALCLSSGPAAWATGPLKIRQGWVAITNVLSPMIFQRTDMMRHYGKSYVVEPVHFAGTSAELTAAATGDVDIITIAYSTLPIAVENAHLTDLRVVADGFQDGVDGYVSSPYLVRNDSGIRTIEDLKGKVVAVNLIGTAVDLAARAMLAEHHLVAGTDYSIVEAEFPTMAAMLLEKKADLIADVPPFAYDPRLQADAHVLFTMKQAMGRSQMIMLAARTGFLAKNHAALDDFFEDLLRGIHWMLDPANRTQAIALAARAAKLPPERLAQFYLTAKDYYRDPDGLPDLAALQRTIDTQRKLGFLKTNFDAAKYVDLSFVKRAERRIDATH